jgi:hypothetical protein|tara:strand:- start:7295 stop:7471 length:177 start_codon:yes stop_codon:yes gene_type:complete
MFWTLGTNIRRPAVGFGDWRGWVRRGEDIGSLWDILVDRRGEGSHVNLVVDFETDEKT